MQRAEDRKGEPAISRRRRHQSRRLPPIRRPESTPLGPAVAGFQAKSKSRSEPESRHLRRPDAALTPISSTARRTACVESRRSTAMYTIRRTTTATLALLSLAVAYLAAAATASAIPILPPGGIQGNVQVQPTVTPTSTVITTGSPWWTFVLVAAAGAAFAVVTGLLIGRLRHAKPAPVTVG